MTYDDFGMFIIASPLEAVSFTRYALPETKRRLRIILHMKTTLMNWDER